MKNFFINSMIHMYDFPLSFGYSSINSPRRGSSRINIDKQSPERRSISNRPQFNISFGVSNPSSSTSSSFRVNISGSGDKPSSIGGKKNWNINFGYNDFNSRSKEENDEINEIAFRKNLSENPLKRQAAERIIEADSIESSNSQEESIKDLIKELESNESSYDYASAREELYSKDISSLSEAERKQTYQTALIDQHVTRDLIGGLVLDGNGSSYVENLKDEYKSDYDTLFAESTARERYIALRKSLQDELGVGDGEDPMSIAMKDIISSIETVKVKERDDDGKIITDEDGNEKEIEITIDNFERYLDDPDLQEAIAEEINRRSYYQNDSYQKIIDDFRAENPEYAPAREESPNETASISESSQKALETLNSNLATYITSPGHDVVDYAPATGAYSEKDSDIKDDRRSWGDYKDIEWDGDHGSIFSSENRGLINELYKENVDDEGSVQTHDQFTLLMLTLLEKGAKGELTNKEVDFLKNITSDSDWSPKKGGTTKEIRNRIIEVIKDNDFWDDD